MATRDQPPDENVYDVLLLSLGDELDGSLQTLLEPIGEAIADSIAGSPDRIAEFTKRYRDDEVAHFLAEEENAVIEDFLGVAFVVSQSAYIAAVVTRLKVLHQLASVRNKIKLTTTDASKRNMLGYGFQPGPKESFSPIEIVDAFANYYKHGDEWGPDWSILDGQQQRTACIIQSVGAYQSSTKNLRTGAEHFGNPAYSNVGTLVRVLSPWRKALVRKYSEEIMSKALR